MPNNFPSLSTDQFAALVELSKQGNLRRAAEVLHISEQGLRNRLVSLEQKMGCELYRKKRGIRHSAYLTEKGQRLLPHAVRFLERAAELSNICGESGRPREVHVVASHYLMSHVLIDAVQRFHSARPGIHVRLSTRTEQEVEGLLLQNPDVGLGVAAPYEASPDLDYVHLFSMHWSLITPHRHVLLKLPSVKLHHLVDQPLILFERGSTGRQHVIEAFHDKDLFPVIAMEATHTDIIVRMVEANLGVSIVPLLPSGVITRGRRVSVRNLGKQIRPIKSGILTRRGEELSEATKAFINFVVRDWSR
jgi:DNA-binding transcriptional LysR family regulator